jgi:glutathione S-transferase
MKLIGSDTSPYVRKVRVVMAEKKIEYRYEREDVWSPNTAIQLSNPLGKVPVLITEDGAAVFDSRVIVEYLDTVTPIQRLIPPSGRARVEVRCWEALADGLLDAAIAARTERTQRPENLRSEAFLARQMSKVNAAVDAMAKGLGDKPWCAEQKYSLADVAVGCALGYLDFRYPDNNWRTRHPALAAYADKVLARQAFIDTAPPAA